MGALETFQISPASLSFEQRFLFKKKKNSKYQWLCLLPVTTESDSWDIGTSLLPVDDQVVLPRLPGP